MNFYARSSWLTITLFLVGVVIGCSHTVWGQSTAHLRVAADSGDTKAMMTLAERYQFGFEAVKNEDSADFYVSLAAKANHPGALYLLGIEKTRKVFDSRTYDAGVTLLKQAAEAGSVEAMLKLHEIYLDKGGSTRSAQYVSTKKAYEYAEMAAQNGNAQGSLYCAQTLLDPKRSPSNDSLAWVYLFHAAEKRRYPQAQLFLGRMYYEGRVDSTRNLTESYHWYTQVIDNKKSTLDNRNQADFAIFDLDQSLKMTHNQLMHTLFLVPEGQLIYRLRER